MTVRMMAFAIPTVVIAGRLRFVRGRSAAQESLIEVYRDADNVCKTIRHRTQGQRGAMTRLSGGSSMTRRLGAR